LVNKPHPYGERHTGGVARTPFLDKSIGRLAGLIKTTYIQWDAAHKPGLFQDLDARVKVLFLLFFVIIVSVKRTLLPEGGICLFVFVLAALSRLNLVSFYGRVLFFGLVFGFLVALPSSVNIIAGGDVIIPILHLSKAHQFWVYHVPQTIGITRQGLESVLLLTLRVVNSLSLSFLVIYTTPFPEIIRALKSLRVPDTFLLILTLTYKYIFIFAKTLEEIHLARKGKTIEVDASEARNWVAGRMAFLLRKTRIRCEEVFNAMVARGFTGDVVLYGCGKMGTRNMLAGLILLIAGAVALMV